MVKKTFLAELSAELLFCSKEELLELIHDRLMNWFREQASLSANFRIPPVALVAEQLKVARQSVQKVYERLEAENIIFRKENERIWRIKNVKKNALKCIALLLPIAFSEYYQLTLEHGQRHFNIYCGMCDRAMESGLVLMPIPLLKLDASEKEINEWISYIRDNFIGVIHLGNRLLYPDRPLHCLCRTNDIPQVSIDWENGIPWGGTIAIDNENVIRTVLAHFREYGHKNICLTPMHVPEKTEGEYTYSSRIFRTFLELNHDSFYISQINAAHRNFDDVFENELDRVIGLQNPPTAFWCLDDITAMNTVKALERRGYKVPDDFSVIGFDNLLETQNFDPPLTTLQAPRYEMGYRAVSKLLECVEHPLAQKNDLELVQCMLYVRQSTSVNKQSFVKTVLKNNILVQNI